MANFKIQAYLRTKYLHGVAYLILPNTRISIVVYINRQIRTHGGLITSKHIRQAVYNKSVHKDYSFVLTFLEDSSSMQRVLHRNKFKKLR